MHDCTKHVGTRIFKDATRRRWGCDATLRRAACAGARRFFRERSQKRLSCSARVLRDQPSSDAGQCSVCIVDTPDRPLHSSEHVQATEGGCMRSDEGSGGLARRARGRRGGRRQAKFRPVPPEGNTFQDALDDSSTSKRSAGSASTYATTPEPTSPAPDAGKPSGRSKGAESVPRSLPELMKRVIHAVKSSGTRLAVYLRGWDSLHPWACGCVDEPPHVSLAYRL